MRCVILESPYSARSGAKDIALNLKYMRACLRHCLLQGEAPFASHGLYTQQGVLNDLIPEDRVIGMEAGFAWLRLAQASVVYTDLGLSDGMHEGIKRATGLSIPIEYRRLPEFIRKDYGLPS